MYKTGDIEIDVCPCDDGTIGIDFKSRSKEINFIVDEAIGVCIPRELFNKGSVEKNDAAIDIYLNWFFN